MASKTQNCGKNRADWEKRLFIRVFQKNFFSFICKCKPGGHVFVSYQSNKKKLGLLSLISGIATIFSVGFKSEGVDGKNAPFKIQKVTVSQLIGQNCKK